MVKVVVVDEEDHEIDLKERKDLLPSDIYRITLLWITDPAGRVLLAQRSLTKRKHAGLWAAAVAGTVEEGETYDSNIVKETKEEIGLEVTLDQLTKGPKKRFNDGVKSNHFAQAYLLTIDKPAEDFVVQQEEVEKLAWFAPEELKQLRKESPEIFAPTAFAWMDLFLPI